MVLGAAAILLVVLTLTGITGYSIAFIALGVIVLVKVVLKILQNALGNIS